MDRAVAWWCDLVGVHDIYSVQIATGIVAGGIALLAAMALLGLAMGILNLFIAVASAK